MASSRQWRMRTFILKQAQIVINQRLIFLMRRLNHALFRGELKALHSPAEIRDIFASMKIHIYELPSYCEIPISSRLQVAPGPAPANYEVMLDKLERRAMRQVSDMDKLVIIVPKSQTHHSRLLALYVIETLIYDILMLCRQRDWSLENIENLATQLAQFALFGRHQDFAQQLMRNAKRANNVLEAMGRLHDDPGYDLPLAPALTYFSIAGTGCQCTHVHYEVGETGCECMGPNDIIMQYHFGTGGLYKTGIQKATKRFLSNKVAFMDYNRWQADATTMAYAYTVGNYQDSAMARRIHPVPNPIKEGVIVPMQRVAVIAKLV